MRNGDELEKIHTMLEEGNGHLDRLVVALELFLLHRS
jgi:hypothetical protein